MNIDVFKVASIGLCDFFGAHHINEKLDYVSSLPNETVTFTDRDVFNVISHSKERGSGVVPGNADLSFLAICRKLPQYDLYVRIEYDVVCRGSVKDALARLIDVAKGYQLGGSFYGGNYEDNWMWWPTLSAPPKSDVNLKEICLHAFFHIMSCQRQFIDVYQEELSNGWKGHFEALMPTIAKIHGHSFVDFSTTHPPLTGHPQFQARYPENVSDTKCSFLHAVKNMGQYHQLMNDLNK